MKDNVILGYDQIYYPVKKDIDKFTKKEAADYFEWYVSHIQNRIAYLETFAKINLDFSEESLTNIWEWFFKNAVIEKTPDESLTEIHSKLTKFLPEDLAITIATERKKRFTEESISIINDIAMYFGQTCVNNNKSIYWGYHTNKRKDSFYNRPLLMGFLDRDYNPPFEAHFDPAFHVFDSAHAMINKGYSDSLMRLYNKWKRLF